VSAVVEPFARGAGYTFDKSLFESDWFDGGSTEFALAHLLDNNDEIAFWLRLQIGDLPLGWAGDARSYNPDFIVVDGANHHWVVEGKSDDAAKDAAVVAKRDAATRWAADVTANTGVSWHYLMVRESDIAMAKDSWAALKKLGGS
jgi:type III restriction enzyme